MLQTTLLTVCMVTKNDAEFLLDSIKEIQHIADELIIVDIGSTDNTVKIAKQTGTVVYQIEWENDYSKVKNYCLDHAKGRWILFLQANETIPTDQIEEIRTLLDNPNVEGYLFYINYNSQVYGIFSPVQTLRLVRNRKEYRYQYKSFEMLPDDQLTSIKDVDIHIIHRYDAAFSWQLSSRIELLEQELFENPKDCYLQYMYGVSCLNQNRFEECISYLSKARETMNSSYLFSPHLYKCLGWALLYVEEYTQCLDVLNDGCNKFPLYRDLFVLRGELFHQQKQYGDAISDFEHCLEMRERANFIVPGPDIDMNAILESAAEVYEQVFSYQKALSCYQELFESDDNNDELLYKITEIQEKIKQTKLVGPMLMDITDVEHIKQFEDILLCRELMKRLTQCLDQLNIKQVSNYRSKKLILHSNEFLKEVYCNLSGFSSQDEDCNSDEVAELHEKIGEYYETANKKVEMLSAYLRVLQYQPSNINVQKKIVQFYNENQGTFNLYFERGEWSLEDDYFYQTSDFKNYIYGMIYFKNQQFEDALSYFNQIKQNDYSYPVVCGYICASLWLSERTQEIQIDKTIDKKEFITIFYNSCKEYVLDKLKETQKKYPYNEIIELEKARITALKY